MYQEFYNLSDLPFRMTPDSRFYFDSGPHKKALAYATYALSKCEGFFVLTGDIGAGKTTIVNHLLSTISRTGTSCVVGKIVSTQLEADDLIRSVAAAFGARSDASDKAALLKQIESKLAQNQRQQISSLLIVDEAQNLSRRSLEELRMLSNFQCGKAAILQVFLVGQPEFQEILEKESMEQLRQRVIVRFHLQPMNNEETHQYIIHRLRVVGWKNDPIIDDDTFDTIYRESAGVPRKINILCDRLLLFGYLEEKHHIGVADLEEVIRDMRNEGLWSAPRSCERTTRSAPVQPIVDQAPPVLVTTTELNRISEQVRELEDRLRMRIQHLAAALKKSHVVPSSYEHPSSMPRSEWGWTIAKTITVREFFERFHNDDVCLGHLMWLRYGEKHECPKCGKEGPFTRLKRHLAYACSKCGHHIHPMVGTPFERSHTPLQKWFYAIYLFTTSQRGVSAKELQRQLGVTYKTAWRIGHAIRKYTRRISVDDPSDGPFDSEEASIADATSAVGTGVAR